MKLQRLLFGLVVFLLSFNIFVSCTDVSDDYQDQVELYGVDKADAPKEGAQTTEPEDSE